MKRLVGFLILFYLVIPCRATHIVGGEMTYRYLGDSRYEVKLKLYVDCFNGSPAAIAQDLYANISFYEGDSGQFLPNLCQSVMRDTPVRVSKTNYNCIKIAPDACVDAYEYKKIVVLPPRKGGYFMTFQRCCRNGTIVNLINPLSTGENIWTKINDTTEIGFNSSPEFRNLPPNFLCTNAPLVFDHSAVDPDGDSLVYEFFHPFSGANSFNPRPECGQYQAPPFSQVNFETGYLYDDAIPSAPAVSLNSKTGLLRIVPTLAGQFVVGILVKEYRDGKLIGMTQRDYQFNVQNCVFETTSAFVNPAVNCNREVFFTNNSQNADKYQWDFGDSTTNADTANTKEGYYRYPAPGSYWVKLSASKGNCVDSIIKLVTVYDRIRFRLPNDTLICQGNSLVLKPDTFYFKANYTWVNGSKDSTLTIASSGAYWLNIQIGNCNSYDTVSILYDSLEVLFDKVDIECDVSDYQLKGLVRVSGRINTLEWSSDPQGLVPPNYKDSVLRITKKGVYWISGENAHGCPFEDSVHVLSIDMSTYFKLGNVFTPNGDTYNEAFPDVSPPFRYHVTIFDRWGIKVFEGVDVPWYANEFADGVYYYFIRMEACGEEKETYGVVHVMHGKSR